MMGIFFQTKTVKNNNPCFKIVLVQPQIPWNTGNIGRTCLGFQCELHLVGKCGYLINDKYLKRAGLDYWADVNVSQFPDIEEYFNNFTDKNAFFLSKKADKLIYGEPIPFNSTLIFGAETKGLPHFLWERFPTRFFKIPMANTIRSINLSTSVGIVLGEAIRQNLSFLNY